jgi:hypothetical protein
MAEGYRIAALAGIAAICLAQTSFQRDVAPILSQKCLNCHGPAQQMAGLNLSTACDALRGGQKGPAVVPGKSEESHLYRRLTGQEQPAMPMGGKLSNAEINALKSWIDSGAHWDGGALSPAAAAAPPTSGTWWSFQKPVRHEIPRAADDRWNRNPIDGFIGSKLKEKGLSPAPPADKRTLIRRAYLDVIGLLPEPAEVDAFVNDNSPDAYAKVVDRLLASPHYGERWARHWLDVARYADSWGHIHDDNPNAWRYRDYVIQALNSDKPYNQFILEQVAGDELDHVTYDSLIATSFHRIGPRVHFREKQNPQYRYDYLDDMMATTAKGFLALTVNCARCHDHKFDPITRMDYYRMMASFFPAVDYDWPLATPAEIARYRAIKAEVDTETKPLKAEVRRIEAPYRRAVFEKKLNTFPEDIQVAVHTPEEQRTPGQKLLATQVLTIATARKRELKLSDADRERVHQLESRIKEIERKLPPPLPVAAGVRDGDYRFTPDGPGDEPVPGTTANRIKVDFKGSYVPEPGEKYTPPPLYYAVADASGKNPEVHPAFLSALSSGHERCEDPPAGNVSTSGRRRALAEWIASEDNPLTARVMVNRIWQHHFGRGIVSTPGNFGRMGARPTHPELLDWLATEFVRSGWSVKAIQRLILTSETYRMASEYYNEANLKNDADDVYLWRFPIQRLEGEVIRDIVLSASGKLNPLAGGPPFFPSVPPAVREDVKKIGRWELTKEEPSTWRRSIYSYWKRARKYPMFEVLDQPDSNMSCERRSTTTVPTQALTLMNDEFVLLQAGFFAQRVEREAGDDPAAQIRTAYRVALSRDPSGPELRGNLRYIEQQRQYHQARNSKSPGESALTDLCAVMLNLNEFVYIN